MKVDSTVKELEKPGEGIGDAGKPGAGGPSSKSVVDFSGGCTVPRHFLFLVC